MRSPSFENRAWWWLIPQEKSFNRKLFGNEVYCTNALLLLITIMLCSKLHCRKVVNWNSFPKRFNRWSFWPRPSNVGTTSSVSKNFEWRTCTWNPRPESVLECLVRAIFAREQPTERTVGRGRRLWAVRVGSGGWGTLTMAQHIRIQHRG